jgi:hypothetical protein
MEVNFEERKERSMKEARAVGIGDVVQGSDDWGVSLDTLECATDLTKRHAPGLYGKIKERQKQQK